MTEPSTQPWRQHLLVGHAVHAGDEESARRIHAQQFPFCNHRVAHQEAVAYLASHTTPGVTPQQLRESTHRGDALLSGSARDAFAELRARLDAIGRAGAELRARLDAVEQNVERLADWMTAELCDE